MKSVYSMLGILVLILGLLNSCMVAELEYSSQGTPIVTALVPPEGNIVATQSTLQPNDIMAPTKYLLIPTVYLPRVTDEVAAVTNTSISQTNVINSLTTASDESLRLSIQLLDPSCYSAGDIVHIEATYENLTNDPLSIADYALITRRPAQLWGYASWIYPLLMTPDGSAINVPEDYLQGDILAPNPPPVQILSGHSEFIVAIDYYFPEQFVILDSHGYGHNELVTDGTYLLRFDYFGFSYQSSWKGKISSNEIALCIKE